MKKRKRKTSEIRKKKIREKRKTRKKLSGKLWRKIEKGKKEIGKYGIKKG